jgi:Domain of unknown function (DUF4385)
MEKPKQITPSKSDSSSSIDHRLHPELYRIRSGEEGVFQVEPYKSELLPLWRFQTPHLARISSQAILALYDKYKLARDFVGMDMARKYLQMGWTRARRYANHKSGRKYDGPVPLEHRGESGAWGRSLLPLEPDDEKARAAAVFFEAYHRVLDDPFYQLLRSRHLERYGRLTRRSVQENTVVSRT